MDMQTEALRALTKEIPINDFGFPTGIYRIDLLPWDAYVPPGPSSQGERDTFEFEALPPPLEDELESGELSEDSECGNEIRLPALAEQKEYRVAGFPGRALQNAFVPLYYDEGFPALANGLPFWSRLEFEPVEAFEAFQKYLLMSIGAAPSSSRGEAGGDIYGEYDGREASGSRSIARLVTERFDDGQLHQMAQLYQDYYHQYYWGLRAHAYDLFRVAQYRKQQELRSIETQTDHYHVSRRLRHRLQQYMDSEEEFWDLMSPKTAIDMLKTLTQLERISAGLPAAGPGAEGANGGGGGTPFEILFRTVAQTNRGSNSGEGRTFDETGEILDAALEDEASTEILQQLVIRSGR